MKEKKKLLQKAGYVYIPLFLEIVGDDVEEFMPKVVNRKLKDCPLCPSRRLKKYQTILMMYMESKIEQNCY